MSRFFACALLAAAALPAAAQPNIPDGAYRRDQAQVLKPEPDPNDGPIYDAAAFRAAYTRAQQPTVAVLWNREFSDMLQQGTAARLVINHAAAGAVRQDVAAVPGYAAGQRVGVVAGSTSITQQEGRTQQARRSGPIERVELQMRSSFLQAVSGAGVRLIDRNVIMRTTAGARHEKDKDDKLDAQIIETAALSKHATLLMEVLNTPDPASPTGWSTFVSVKRLADGLLVMEGYFDGNPQEGAPRLTPRFEADPRGGFREVAPTVGDVGRRVAEQALARLAEALSR